MKRTADSGGARSHRSPRRYPMPAHRKAITVAFILLLGCAHAPSPMNPNELMPIGIRIFRTGCPSIAAVTERRIRNPHNPAVVDTIKTTSCDGIELSTYVGAQASNPAGLPIYLEIRKPHKELPEFMNVGEPLRVVLDVLGKPFKRSDRSVTYRIGEVDDTVTFSVSEGLITSVRWDWYLD